MKFKRGDTFEYSGPVVLTVNGVDTDDLTDYSVSSQVRTLDGELLGDLTATFLSRSPAILHIIYDGSTAEWPPGKAKIDFEYVTPSGRIVSSDTVFFPILNDVTRGNNG